MSLYPSRVVLREVGMRDGLQSLSSVLPTERKIEWIDAAYAAGLREIEVGSFVPPERLPQLADTPALVAHARTLPGLSVSALVPNLKGAERALVCGVDRLLVPLSASHAHSLANLRKTPEDVIAEVGRIRAARDAAGAKTKIEGGVGTAFGCTLQGAVAQADVMRCLAALLDVGADHVSVADTVGYAGPGAVSRLLTQARELVGERLRCAHFHDTRGLALANVVAALDAGVSCFDTSLGGIGGCPHAPGASGNVATEDLAFMLGDMQIATGLDVDALLALRARLTTWLPDETFHGALARAGLPHWVGASHKTLPAAA